MKLFHSTACMHCTVNSNCVASIDASILDTGQLLVLCSFLFRGHGSKSMHSSIHCGTSGAAGVSHWFLFCHKLWHKSTASLQDYCYSNVSTVVKLRRSHHALTCAGGLIATKPPYIIQVVMQSEAHATLPLAVHHPLVLLQCPVP